MAKYAPTKRTRSMTNWEDNGKLYENIKTGKGYDDDYYVVLFDVCVKPGGRQDCITRCFSIIWLGFRRNFCESHALQFAKQILEKSITIQISESSLRDEITAVGPLVDLKAPPPPREC